MSRNDDHWAGVGARGLPLSITWAVRASAIALKHRWKVVSDGGSGAVARYQIRPNEAKWSNSPQT